MFYLPVTQNEPIFPVLTSPNSTEITKLVLDNNTSICLSEAASHPRLSETGLCSKPRKLVFGGRYCI